MMFWAFLILQEMFRNPSFLKPVINCEKFGENKKQVINAELKRNLARQYEKSVEATDPKPIRNLRRNFDWNF